MIYGTLGLPYGSMEEISPLELVWMLEGMYEKQREDMELWSHVIKVSIASANSGKNIKLFKPIEKQGKQTTKQFSSKEQKLSEFQSLLEQF